MGNQARSDSQSMDWSNIHTRFALLLNDLQEDQNHEPAPAYE